MDAKPLSMIYMIYGYIDYMYLANYLIQTESKHYVVLIPSILSD